MGTLLPEYNISHFEHLYKTITVDLDYFSHETYRSYQRLSEGYGELLLRGMQKTSEESAFNSPLEIDTRAFMWTFNCLDEDHELERFFAGLPGFRGSKMVKDPLSHTRSAGETFARVDRIDGSHFHFRFIARAGQNSENCHL